MAGVATLMEIAEAYHSRASEITAGIQRAEADNVVARGDGWYKFRVGELRTFTEACILSKERRNLSFRADYSYLSYRIYFL